jgi:hypothetical protein
MPVGVSSVGSFELFFDLFAGIALALLVIFASVILTHFIVKQIQVIELARREARLLTSQELVGSSALHQGIAQVALAAASLAGWVTSVGGFVLDETRALLENAGLFAAALVLAATGIGFLYYGDLVLATANFLYVDIIGIVVRVSLSFFNVVVLGYSAVIPVWNAFIAFLAAAFAGNGYALAICARPAFAPVLLEATLGAAETSRGVVNFVGSPDRIISSEINVTDGFHAFGRAVGELRGVAVCACPALSGITNATLDVFARRETAVTAAAILNTGVSLIQALPQAAIFEDRPTLSRPADHATTALSGVGNFTDSLLLAAFYKFGAEARGLQANASRDEIPLALAVTRFANVFVSGVNISLNALAAADEIFDEPANEELLLDFAPVFTEARQGFDALSDIVGLADEDLGHTVRFGARFGLSSLYALQRTAVGLAFNRELDSSPEALADYLQTKAWPGWIDPVWANLDQSALFFGRFISSGTPALTGTITLLDGDTTTVIDRPSECSFYVKNPVNTGDLNQTFSGALVSSGLRTGVAAARLATQATFFIDKLVAPGVEGGVPHVCTSEWQSGKNGLLDEMRAFVQAASCSLSQLQATGTPALIADCGLPPPPPPPQVTGGVYFPTCPSANPSINDTDLGKIVDVFECSGQAVEDWGLAIVDVLADAWLYSENVILVAEGALPSNMSDCLSVGYATEPKFDIKAALELANDGAEQVGCLAAALVPEIGIEDGSVRKFRQRLPCLARASFNLVFVLPLQTLDLFYTDTAGDTLNAQLPPGAEEKNYLNGITLLLIQARDATAEFLYALGITLNAYEFEGVGAGEIAVDLSSILREDIDNAVIEDFVDINQDAIRAGVAFIRISQSNGAVIFASLLGNFLEDLGRIIASVGFRLLVDGIDALLPGWGGSVANFITKTAQIICTVFQPVINAIIDAINSLAKGAHWLSFGASPSLDLSLNLNCAAFPTTSLDTSHTGNMQTNIHGRPYCPQLYLPTLSNITEGNVYHLPGEIEYAWQLSTQAGQGCRCVEPLFSNPDGPNPDYFQALAAMYPFYQPNVQQNRIGGFGDCRPGQPQEASCGSGGECVSGVCRQTCHSDNDCAIWVSTFADPNGPAFTKEFGLFANEPVCASGYCSMFFDPEAMTANMLSVATAIPDVLGFVDGVQEQANQECRSIDYGLQCGIQGGGLMFFEGLRVFAQGGTNDDWIALTRTFGSTSPMEKFTRCENYVPPDVPEWERDDPFCSRPIVGPTSISQDSSGFTDVCVSAATVAALCYNDSTPNAALPPIESRIKELTSWVQGPTITRTGPGNQAYECAFALREEVVSQSTPRASYEDFWSLRGFPTGDFAELAAFAGDNLQQFENDVDELSSFVECACRDPSGEGDTYAGKIVVGRPCVGTDQDPCNVNTAGIPAGFMQIVSDRASFNAGIPSSRPYTYFCSSLFLDPTGPLSSTRNYMYADAANFASSKSFGPSVSRAAQFSQEPLQGVVGAREGTRELFGLNATEGRRDFFRSQPRRRRIRQPFVSHAPRPQRLYDHRRNPTPQPTPLDGLTLGQLPEFLYNLLRDPTTIDGRDAYTIGTAFTKTDTTQLSAMCRKRYDRVRKSVESSAKRIGYNMASLQQVDGGVLDLTPVFGKVASPLVVIDALSCMEGMPKDVQGVLSDLTTEEWTGDAVCDRLVQELAYDEWHGRWPVPSERIVIMECIKARAAASVFRSLLLTDEIAEEFPLEMFYSWHKAGATALHVLQGAVTLFMDDSNATQWDRSHIGDVLDSVGIDDGFARALLDFAFEPGRAERTMNRTIEHLQTVLYSHHFFDEDHNPRQTMGFFVRYFELFERILDGVTKRNIGSKVGVVPFGLYRAVLDSTRMAFTAGRRVTAPVGVVGVKIKDRVRGGSSYVGDKAARVRDAGRWAGRRARQMLNGTPFHELTDDPTCRRALNGEDSSVYLGFNCPVVDKPIQVGIDYLSEGYHWWTCALPLINENYARVYYPYYLAVVASGGHNETGENLPVGVINVDERCRRPSNSSVSIPSQEDPSVMLRTIRVGHGVHSFLPYRTHNSSFTNGQERNVTVPNFSLVEDVEAAQGTPNFDTSDPNLSAYSYLLSISKDLGLGLGAAIDSVFNFILDERPFDPTVQNTEPQGGLRWYFQQAITCEPIAVFGQAPYRRTLRRGLEITTLLILSILLFSVYFSVAIYAAGIITMLYFPILFYVTYGMGFTCTLSLILPVPLANDVFDLVACLFPACIIWPSELIKSASENMLPQCLNPISSPGFVNPCFETGVVDFVWGFFLSLRWQFPSAFDWFASSSNPLASLLRTSAYFKNILDSLANVPNHPLPADYLTCLVFQALAITSFGIAFAVALRALAPLLNQLITGAVLLGTNLWTFGVFVIFAVHDMFERYVELGSREAEYEDRLGSMAEIAYEAGEKPDLTYENGITVGDIAEAASAVPVQADEERWTTETGTHDSIPGPLTSLRHSDEVVSGLRRRRQ